MEMPNPNPGKNLIIEVNNKKYIRYPIKTHLITSKDKMIDVVFNYTKDYLKQKDIVFIGERSLAISQNRSYEIDKVKPSKLANFLVKFVTKSSYGIGLGSPQTMQLAIEEVGKIRIIFAAIIGGLTKFFGIKGVFYKIAGPQAKAVDGAAPYVIPPYNRHVTKAPLNADKIAQEISDKIKVPVVIIDACDFGVWVVGKSKGVDEKLIIQALKDNPLGQTNEQTPIGILREVYD
ncbi:MAG: coenzyme F420-0:L-glutamate ligase [Candidatus Pacebacteria bacterium]|nr:coenzyme F420-0:L-glutamate ligase [Candidatus Paceibacterota bacterium]